MRLSSLAAILILVWSIDTATSLAQSGEETGWVGKKIILKRLGVKTWATDGEGRLLLAAELKTLDYVVLAEERTRIKVSQQSVEGWLDKSEAVQLADAEAYFTKILAANPQDDNALHCRGVARTLSGAHAEAIADLTEAVRLNPKTVAWRNSRGLAYRAKKEYAAALADYMESMRIDPQDAVAFNKAAWLLAVCPIAKIRDGNQSVAWATRACELTSWKRPGYIDSLAAAYAESGRFEEAARFQRLALEDAGYVKRHGEWAKKLLAGYEKKEPYREE